MGWNWVKNLAQHCRLTVITEAEFQNDIEAAIKQLPLAFVPEFHFINIGKEARGRCWNQGNWRFYLDYKRWQRRAYQLAQQLVRDQSYEVCHHLGMIGYREPGYLWQLPLPFVWGPVGGYAQMPLRYLPALGAGGGMFHACRNVVNAIQMRSLKRVKSAARKASAIIAATLVDQAAIETIYHKSARLISETGTEELDGQSGQVCLPFTGTLTLVWCGKFVARKALSIALFASKVAQERGAHLRLHIIGNGKKEQDWKALANRLGIGMTCEWHGQIDHDKALAIIRNSHVLLITSLQEATSTVVMEALACGVPIICHDTCGFGAVVDSSCGIKVPLHTFSRSVEGFAEAIVSICKRPEQLELLSRGSYARSKDLTWSRKAEAVLTIYREVSRNSVTVDGRGGL